MVIVQENSIRNQQVLTLRKPKKKERNKSTIVHIKEKSRTQLFLK